VVSQPHPSPAERDERLSLPLDSETALRALLKVDPDAPAADERAPKDYKPEHRT